MVKTRVVTERIVHTPKLRLTNPTRISQLVQIFDEIWVNSKANANYSTDFFSLMRSTGISDSTIRNIKKAALRRRLFIYAQGKAIRFRDDLCRPNPRMLTSLIVDEVQLHPVYRLKDYQLINELRVRNYHI